MFPEIRTIRYNYARLEEGSFVKFTVLKMVALSDHEAYFVLLDPQGYKILLPYEIYSQYGIKEGSIITCRIDKVNCSGQVFLEPQHPFYKEGYFYEFEIKGHKNILENGFMSQHYLELSDALGLGHTVAVQSTGIDEYLNTGKIRCLVERIKKARLYLRPENEINSSLIPGSYYSFIIEDSNVNYFSLLDTFGNLHRIETLWYTHYNLKKGQKINCRFLHYAEDGTLILEPENPVYKEGNTYKFEVRYYQKKIYADGSEELTAVVNDYFGEEAHIKVPADLNEHILSKKTVTARIDRIRKSRVHGTATM